MKGIKAILLCCLQFTILIFSCVSDGNTQNLTGSEPANSSPPLIIGLDADMSAGAVEGGVAIKRGAQLAIDEINAAGGVLGRSLSLLIKDHRGNPARGKFNISAFAKTENLVAVMGGVHTPVVLEELPLLHENKLIFLDPWAAGTPIVDNGYLPNFVFRVSVRDAEAGMVMMSHAKSMGKSKVALLLERTGWGRSNERSLSIAAEKLGISISTIVWVNWRQKSMQDEMDTIARSDAEAIMLVVNSPEGVVAMNSFLDKGLENKLGVISHWGIAGGNFVEQVGIDALNKIDLSVLQTFSFASDDQSSKKARIFERYKQNYEQSVIPESVPGAVGVAHAYDLVHLLKIAIENAGTTDSSKVRDALENIEEYQGLVKYYKPPFTPSRHDALLRDDYIMSSYDERGFLIPIGTNQ